MLDFPPCRGDVLVHVDPALSQAGERIVEHRSGTNGRELLLFAGHPTPEGRGGPTAKLPDLLQLRQDVRHNTFGGVGGGGGPQVGNIVENGIVGFVADGGHHRGAAFGDRVLQGFLREREEVFDGTAAAGNDNHIHVGVGVEFGEGCNDFRHGPGPLDRGVDNGELDVGPATLRDGEHVAFGGGAAPGDEPNIIGQEGEGVFAGVVEKPLGGESASELFDAGQHGANAHRSNLGDP